jgi:hypothetical protein
MTPARAPLSQRKKTLLIPLLRYKVLSLYSRLLVAATGLPAGGIVHTLAFYFPRGCFIQSNSVQGATITLPLSMWSTSTVTMSESRHAFLVLSPWNVQARVGREETIRFERKPDVVRGHPVHVRSPPTYSNQPHENERRKKQWKLPERK